ncbi:hypothetical protein HanRHA438_Chr04g0161421 [Helianthus annuus]|nr:hypothetical protein HanRHA438_Chr04g0161421 [Helianthus annuus]
MALRECSFAFGIIFMLMTTHFSVVHCRNLQLRTTTTTIEATEFKQTGGEMAELIVSSTNNVNRRLKMGSLGYKLASGPSKKGPGH